MGLGRVGLAVAAAAFASPATAQTSRENAVAIDRVPVPPADRFEVEAIGPPLAAPWSLAFLPDGSFLVVEKHGGVRIVRADGSATPRLAGGPPNVLQKSDSGLLDVALDPDFAANRLVYLAFAEGSEAANRTALFKARLEGDRLTGGRVIFRVGEAKRDSAHPGGRLLFLPDKTLLLTIGDGFEYRDAAQDPGSHLGKIVRLTRDGAAAPGNPFLGRAGFLPEIWSLGHRNIQGLARDPVTGTVWSHEHGPRGGDEINALTAGANYGWPRASFGIDYDGKLITDRLHLDGLADPRFTWSPSIAPSGLAVYRGTVHPEMDGRLLVGALAARSLVQVRVHPTTGLLAEEGRWLGGLKARLRDVRVAPDGRIYLLTDDPSGRLLRLLPPSAPAAIPADSPLAPMAFLVGRWAGASRFTPAFRSTPTAVEETSQIDCAPALKATYIRCTVQFHRTRDGRLRVVEHVINRDPAKPGVNVLVLDSGWPGRSSYTQDWSSAERAWIGLIPTDHDGRPATERIVVTPSADGKSLVHTESLRLDSAPNAPWTETFRWTWTRR
ncbi:PQQ-dependent sugar dehydrogenase [Sphingomonas sp.]|uniref:PQQ-dependent sugar dehydrogenase n=1 Tax=Sphingomonas sp. TaxID=28214 RepID=UPI00286E9953|nr:PQQ-dependent sugar dehydrogenase [Sphingomonas sp.]